MGSLLAALALAVVGYIAGSITIISEGTEGVVERLGKYRRSLEPGLNFVIPVLDNVLVESTREQILDIDPQQTITKDNVPLTVDAVIFWKILDGKKARYGVEDLESALTNLVVTALRGEVGQMELRQTVSARDNINRSMLHQLDEATANWGVKIMRVEVQEIKPSAAMLESLELEQTAEIKRKATLSETESMVESIRRIALALQGQPNSQAVLQYLIAQRYVEANLRLGESENSKIIFMDPKTLTETIGELIAADQPELGNSGNSHN